MHTRDAAKKIRNEELRELYCGRKVQIFLGHYIKGNKDWMGTRSTPGNTSGTSAPGKVRTRRAGKWIDDETLRLIRYGDLKVSGAIARKVAEYMDEERA